VQRARDLEEAFALAGVLDLERCLEAILEDGTVDVGRACATPTWPTPYTRTDVGKHAGLQRSQNATVVNARARRLAQGIVIEPRGATRSATLRS